jgi:hypothetical protein
MKARIVIDPDLLQYDEAWAAAKTRNDLFPIERNGPVRVASGRATNLKRS